MTSLTHHHDEFELHTLKSSWEIDRQYIFLCSFNFSQLKFYIPSGNFSLNANLIHTSVVQFGMSNR